MDNVSSGLKRGILIFMVIAAISASGCVTVPRQIPPVTVRPEGIYHIVGSGQNLYRISKAYGVDIKQIMRLNNIKDPNEIGVGQELFIPRVTSPLSVAPYKPFKFETIEKIVGPRHAFSKWRYITIHHSATLEGNAEAFDRNHRRRGMGGLFYHFVIGNGSGSGNGEVEVGWRWRRQVQVERPQDIQICLVGNFNVQDVSEPQFKSLVELVKVLCRQYNIPSGNIRRHKDCVKKITECPGNKFPFYRLLSELRRR